jgi:hypothetical protein
MKYIILLILLSGCTSLDRLDMTSSCPFIEITYVNSSPDFTVDHNNYNTARLSCSKYYGAGACLTKFTKIAPLTYHAICRRSTK